MKRFYYWFFGSVLLLLALFLGVKEASSNSFSDSSGEELFFFFGSSQFKDEGVVPKKSQNQRTQRSSFSNPIVGDDWRDLLTLIPPRPVPGEVSFSTDEVPSFFEDECEFLAQILGKRLGRSPLQRALMAKQLLRKRQESWNEMVEGAASVTSNGRSYLLGPSSDFEKELWPEHWVKEVWPISELSQEAWESGARGRELSSFKNSLDSKLPKEIIVSLFEEEESPENGAPSRVSGLLRRDEVLLWFWIAPELKTMFEKSN